MLISHEYNFIFIHIGKTGGTSIEKVLCEYLNTDFEETKKDPDGNWWKHAWAKDMRKRVGLEIWRDYFTFSFVRNPYDMILSLYCMYTQYPEYTNPDVHPALYHPWNQYRDFEDFIVSMGKQRYESDKKWHRQLDKLGVKTQIQVWNSLKNLQTSYLTESWKGLRGPGKILVDFVGRFENFCIDFHAVCSHIGLPKLDLIHHGITQHQPYQEVYTQEMKQIVYQHFSLDIERFSYKF